VITSPSPLAGEGVMRSRTDEGCQRRRLPVVATVEGSSPRSPRKARRCRGAALLLPSPSMGEGPGMGVRRSMGQSPHLQPLPNGRGDASLKCSARSLPS
jgi:hypothetical protein